MQGQGEGIVQIHPGPPNTSIDRSAIQDHEAQDVLNCMTAGGVWELDQRYRQFAPNPTTITDVVNVTHALPCFLVQTPGSPATVHSCAGLAVSGSCSIGWGYNGGSGIVCLNGTPNSSSGPGLPPPP